MELCHRNNPLTSASPARGGRAELLSGGTGPKVFQYNSVLQGGGFDSLQSRYRLSYLEDP